MIEEALLTGLEVQERRDQQKRDAEAAHARAVQAAIAEAHATLARGG